MITEKEAKRAIIDAGKLLLKEKLVVRTWGNVSCRTGEQTFVITPSGLSYEKTTQNDLVSYDITTSQWVGSRKPSSERGIHLAAYLTFPQAGFVIHTHQTYASALSLGGFEALKLNESQKALLGNIAVAKYGLPSTKALVKNASKELKKGANIVLLNRHGVIIVAKDKDEAFLRAKLLEEVCKNAVLGQPEEQKESAAQEGATKGKTKEQLAQSPSPVDDLQKLAEQVAPHFPFTACEASPAAVKVSLLTKSFPAQLDDMAQMIGGKLLTVKNNSETVIKTLKKYPALLVEGLGMICRADSQSDCHALKLLVEKACVCYLHTRALNIKCVLSPFDRTIMRLVYKSKYSKKSEG